MDNSFKLTKCEYCKNGFSPSKDYIDMKNEDDIIINWCRKCNDKSIVRNLINQGISRHKAKKILKESLIINSVTIDYDNAIEIVKQKYIIKPDQF